jgi:hypothetical protein
MRGSQHWDDDSFRGTEARAGLRKLVCSDPKLGTKTRRRQILDAETKIPKLKQKQGVQSQNRDREQSFHGMDKRREKSSHEHQKQETKTQTENQPRGATRCKKMRSCGSEKSVWEKPDLTCGK